MVMPCGSDVTAGVHPPDQDVLRHGSANQQGGSSQSQTTHWPNRLEAKLASVLYSKNKINTNHLV